MQHIRCSEMVIHPKQAAEGCKLDVYIVFVRMQYRLHVFICMHMHVYVCICTSMHICVYAYL